MYDGTSLTGNNEITDCITQILYDSDICITAKKRQRHLSLTKQATGGLENERQSDIKTPLGRPQQSDRPALDAFMPGTRAFENSVAGES